MLRSVLRLSRRLGDWPDTETLAEQAERSGYSLEEPRVFAVRSLVRFGGWPADSRARPQLARGELLARHGVVRELVGTVGRRGFVVEPRRWKVEQTFGCLQRYRRLRVDDEMSNETSRHVTVLASLFMTGMRLERMLQT